MDSISQKRCPKCGQVKPATPTYFHRNNTKKSGLAYRCKECINGHDKTERKGSHPLKTGKRRDPSSYDGRRRKMREDGTILCTGCKQWKPATSDHFFRVRQRSYTGFASQCKQCTREKRSVKMRMQNQSVAEISLNRTCTKCNETKPATLEYFAYKADNQGRKRMQTICRECIATEKRQYRIAHQDLLRESARRRRARDPEDHRTRNRNRKAKLKSIPGKHTKEDIRQQYERQKGKCYWCEKMLKWGDHTVDHVIPVTRKGSSNDPWNIVIACSFCNASKKNRLPHEWKRSGGRMF